jgi:hypothetical protein
MVCAAYTDRHYCVSNILVKKEGNMLQIFERRIFIIYGAINDNDVWITGYNNELYMLCNELDIVKVIRM